ncbi:hypothetical protein KUCAC02_031592 [Chaenocephalus aceratus]|nr:hypothetical protein KUCAC02_031592 [Chaenocephalus aceratus]
MTTIETKQRNDYNRDGESPETDCLQRRSVSGDGVGLQRRRVSRDGVSPETECLQRRSVSRDAARPDSDSESFVSAQSHDGFLSDKKERHVDSGPPGDPGGRRTLSCSSLRGGSPYSRRSLLL